MNTIGALALKARRYFCPALSDAEAFHGIEVFEMLPGRKVIEAHRRIAVDIDVKPLNKSIEAYTTFEADDEQFVLCLSETTYAGLEMGVPRDRFTFCHELGHLMMHRPELMTLRALPAVDRLLARAAVDHPIYMDTEWQADTFAARLLVPDAGLQLLALDGKLDASYVANRFGVSHGAARVRLRQFLACKGGAA